MIKTKSAFGAVAIGIACAFSTQTSTASPTDDVAEMYNRISGLSYLKDPRTQCVSIRHPESSGTPDIQNKAKNIFAIMQKTPMSAELLHGFSEVNGALCFVEPKSESGASNLNYAMNFTEYDTIIINDSPKADMGCVIAASVHEMQHTAQKYAGFASPMRELEVSSQENLVLTIEADAHTVQIIGSEMLSRAGYKDAKACNENKFAPDMPHMKDALDTLENTLKSDPNALANGNAATKVYNQLVHHNGLIERYGLAVRFYYDCFSYPAECFRGNKTLGQLGLNLSDLSKIHYDSGYTVTPFSSTVDNKLALSPVR
ncbi:MAG: hypothetical protein PHX61_03200 [Alphaproteobacteria bacterium]|nr:hypothetical protein [Alphaproteobacteria bacterium]